MDFQNTFNYLAFHTPFAGMVKGAHRKLMRQLVKANPAQIEADFQKRVAPSLAYCVQVGNVYSATLYLALCGFFSIQKKRRSKSDIKRYGAGKIIFCQYPRQYEKLDRLILLHH